MQLHFACFSEDAEKRWKKNMQTGVSYHKIPNHTQYNMKESLLTQT